MELRQFTYVNQVAECGSFTKAAAKLFISQPALSNYISKVEEDLGVKLFDRSATPLKLTYAGEQYLKRAKVILGQMEDMNRELRDITHNMAGRLRIGFPSERIVYMLPLILKPLKDRYPGIDVEVSTGPGNHLIVDLKAGNVDFVFLPYWNPIKDVVQVQIAEEELILVAAKGYLSEDCFLDREKKIINWREAAKLPVIEVAAPKSVIGTCTREAVQSGVVLGEIARIDGLIDMIERETGEDCSVVVTGSDARAIASLLQHAATPDETLTLRGLARLHVMNRK